MVLRNDFNGKMILQYRNVRMPSHGFHQPALDFESRVVSMMQDTEFRMAALTMQIEVTLFILVEVHPHFTIFLMPSGARRTTCSTACRSLM